MKDGKGIKEHFSEERGNKEELKGIKNEESSEEHKKRDKKKEKKQERLFIYSVIFLIVVFGIFFSAKYFYHPKIEYPSYTYNGFVFTKDVINLWNTDWQKGNVLYHIKLHYGPRETENVAVVGSLNEDFFSKNIYVTFDPGYNLKYVALASAELSLSLAKALGINPIAACTKNITKPCYKRPKITCNNTNKSVIYIKKVPINDTKVILYGNCMIIQGKEMELVKAVDRVVLIWYGIMKGNA